MSTQPSPHQQYLDWVEERIEDFKCALTRDELLGLADQAVCDLFHSDDQQVPLTEILLRDAVDTLIFHRLGLPSYRRWLRMCRSDTSPRPQEGTHPPDPDQLQAS